MIFLQLEVCKEQVQWAQTEKRTFLRQRIEVRLATLYLETKDYTAAISLIGKLLTEVRVHINAQICRELSQGVPVSAGQAPG